MGVMRVVCLVLTLSVSAVGQAHDRKWHNGTAITVGAILGGVVGYQIDRHDGAVVGSILGAIAGSSEHHHSSSSSYHAEYFSEAEERRIRESILRRIKSETLTFSYDADELFESSSAKLKSNANAKLHSVASGMKRFERTLVRITGFSSSEDKLYHNKILGLGMADSVAQYLVIQGIPRSRMQTEGVGEFPAAAQSGTEVDTGVPLPPGRVEVIIEPVFSDLDRR